MLLTEEEAKERWCPFDRSYLMPDPTTDTGEMRCMGSECMAWRWGADDAALNEQMHGRDAKSEFGYCGLAGKP